MLYLQLSVYFQSYLQVNCKMHASNDAFIYTTQVFLCRNKFDGFTDYKVTQHWCSAQRVKEYKDEQADISFTTA